MTVIQELKTRVAPYIHSRANSRAVERVFCFDECFVFKENRDQGFEILQSIAEHFKVPLRSVHVVGSAQLGYSFMKDRDFVAGDSDLDIAIVHSKMFLEYHELCYKITNKYRNLTVFPRHGNLEPSEVATLFRENLAKGYFRPDYMPLSDERREWLQFFERLGDAYVDKFKKITCGIYLSQMFFTSKQEEVIGKIMEKKEQ